MPQNTCALLTTSNEHTSQKEVFVFVLVVTCIAVIFAIIVTNVIIVIVVVSTSLRQAMSTHLCDIPPASVIIAITIVIIAIVAVPRSPVASHPHATALEVGCRC